MPTKRGYLFDLGPDGLGFVREAEPPHDVWPLSLARLDASAVDLEEGAPVSFELRQGRIVRMERMECLVRGVPMKPAKLAATPRSLRQARKSA